MFQFGDYLSEDEADESVSRSLEHADFLVGNPVEGPPAPAFVDLEWLRRNTFSTSVDVKGFVHSLTRPDLVEAFAGCTSRDDFLQRLLPLANRWDVLFLVASRFGMFKGPISRCFFGPLLTRAYAALWPDQAPPPLPTATMDIQSAAHRLLNDPAHRDLGEQAFWACLVVSAWLTTAASRCRDTVSRAQEAPDWFEEHDRFLLEFDRQAPRIDLDDEEDEDDASELQEAFDRDWIARSYTCEDGAAEDLWFDLGDIDHLAWMIHDLRLDGSPWHPLEGAVASLRDLAPRYKSAAKTSDVEFADAVLSRGSRKDVEIARGAVLGILLRPDLDPDLGALVRKHRSKLQALVDLYDARIHVEGRPVREKAPPPKPEPSRRSRTKRPPARSEDEPKTSPNAIAPQEDDMLHVKPKAIPSPTPAWEATARALSEFAAEAALSVGVDAMQASLVALRARLATLEGIVEAEAAAAANAVDPWEGIEAVLADLAAIEPRSRAKGDTRDCAILAEAVASARETAAGPDMALAAELAKTATILADRTLDLFETLKTVGFDADLMQRAGVAAKEATHAYELAYDEVANALAATDAPEETAVAVTPLEPEPVSVPEVSAHQPIPAEPIAIPEPCDESPAAETVATVDPQPVAETPETTVALRRLVAERALGQAYHLSRAVEASGATPAYGSGELRIAAVAGRLSLSTINVTGMPAEIRDALGSALSIAETDSFGEGPDADARRLLAFAGAIEPALVGRDHSAMAIVERITLDPAWNKASFPLKEAVRSASKGGQPLTVELFKGLRDADESRRDLETARQEIKAACAFLGRQSFPNFPTGTRTALALGERGGEVGSLAAQVDGSPVQAYNAAKRFAQAYSTESGADDLIHKGKESFAHPRERRVPITGKVRSSMVGAIHAITDACAAYVAARDAAAEIEGGKRGHYDEIRSRLLSAVDACVAGTAARPCATPQETGAAATLLDALTRLRLILDGEIRNPGPHDHLLALHAPLATIDGLRHGRGWLPGGQDLEGVVAAIGGSAPFREDAGSISSAFERRLAQGATSSASILLDLARSLALPTEGMTAQFEATLAALRPVVAAQLESARRTLGNIERGGDPAEQEEAARLSDSLDLIDLSRLPIQILPETRTEEPDAAATIVDFAGVTAIVEGILARGHVMNARRRTEMHADLDAVERAGKISPDTVARVRRIVDEDDLVYASEWIANLQAGVEVPEDRKPDGSFPDFFPVVPAFLSKQGPNPLAAAAELAETGVDHGPLAFGRIGPGRRAAARDFLLAFENLNKVVRDQGRSGGPAVVRHLMECFGKLGILPVGQPETLTDAGTGSTRSISFQIGLDIPQDENSTVLPDFGSQTLGRWSLMVTPTLPSDQEIAKFMANASLGGHMVVVTGLVGVEERRKLAQSCRAQRRKLLVVDAAVATSAAAEPALRAASIVELAQPFAFATPFRDHGRGAVPPEMYMGRKQEMALIVDPFGPCVVYGARRNGKTATLLHVAATNHAPKAGFVAVQISVQGIGKTEGGKVDDVWQKISAAMPDVFRTPVFDRDSFGAGVRRYLDAKATRRILLMLDECDDVIEKDAEKGFQAFLTLQELMETTQRRFKVVFAGLRNVSRLVRDGNAPLKHIASNPIRIGPFVGVELAEAERLVTKPFAAMGYRFASRDLVWRMLARANFAPGLVQVMCERVLEFLRARPFDPRNNPPVLIDDAVVRDALADEKVMDAVVKTFFISVDYDRRYVLLANVIANSDIGHAEAGVLSEGMTLSEIHREASAFWAALFGGVDGLALVEDTVDEMEGLGLVKRLGDERWALRSPSIRRLLGTREAVESRLEGFLTSPPSTEFDFRSNRKSLARPGSAEPDHLAPLTGAQIGKVFRGRSPVMVASGSAASDISYVVDALADDAGSYRGRVAPVTALTTPKEIASALHAACAQPGEHLLVVGTDRKWDVDWVREAASVAYGNRRMSGECPEVRILFVADPRRSLAMIEDKHPISVDWVVPRPWSDGMLDRAGEKYGVTLIGEERETFAKVTGNLNGLASSALRAVAGVADKDRALKEWFAAESTKDRFLVDLGILAPLAPWFAQAGAMVGIGEDLTVEMVGELLDGCKRPRRFVNYATRMGLASTSKDASDNTFVVFNPILKTIADATK